MKKHPLLEAPGFFMPAEFSEHDGTLMLMPFRGDVWRNKAKDAQAAFLRIAQTIAQFERVFIGVHPSIASEFLSLSLPNITFFECASNDAWMRDVGPTFVKDKDNQWVALDWQFNAYGGLEHGLYPDWDQDDKVASSIAQLLGTPAFRTDGFVMEGGAFHVDGNGLVMATEYNLLHPGRNPNLTKEDIEKIVCHLLGAKKMIWLPRGIYHDETREHVDNVATFIAPGHILLAYATDVRDAQQPLSERTKLALESQTDVDGNPLKITTITMPKPIHRTYFESSTLELKPGSKARPMNERLAASYLNLYFVNGGVIVPQFNQKFDPLALEQMTAAFPDRKVVMVDSKEVLLGGGNIHCITQQIPKGVLKDGKSFPQSGRRSNGDDR